MTSKRGKPEIIFDILRAVQESGGKMKPTRLLYKSNLSHARLKLYLESLVRQQMLAIEGSGSEGRNLIALTQKGYSFVAEFRKMKALIESFGI
ncbi:hypothetical protein HYU16_01425 [Candidatus Woesearchaeota archaeon]|nr:hypothetical protein [Candidatus Woesearchaeota archaeon]